MNINTNNMIVKILLGNIQKYNHYSYWKMRVEVVNPFLKKSKILRYWYLYRIKKSDGFNNASMGTDMGKGAHFASPPILHHGLNGIIIGHNVRIGSNATIFQQVTIGHTEPPIEIGDNVFIGAGAKIIQGVKIGDNVKIGANAVVTKDIPSNCTAIGVPARVIKT